MLPTKRDAGSRGYPTVSVVTAHGRQPLASEGDERLIDLLNRHGVPWSGVSVYRVPKAGGEPLLCSALDATLSQLDDAAEILLYFNRNVNPFMFSLARFKTVDSADPAEPDATEYLYQRLDNARSSAEVYLKKLSPPECRAAIARLVAETVREALPPGSHLVVGVSGGGDSNSLLYGLSQLRDHGLTIHPVIIKGIPDWDQGVPRAQELCASYGLPLRVMEEDEVKALLGIPGDSTPLIDRFEREFPGDDFEFLGTLLIRLALARHARDVGTSFICTGLNLEDVLCEGMFRLSTGLPPAPVPVRAIGDVTLVLPLWLCPKRIIDGCFPKYSLANYQARYPCFSLGRNLYYSVVYAMQSQFPGFPEQLARGLSQLAAQAPATYMFDDQLGFHVERFVPLGLRTRFLRMLGRDATAAPSP
jgi:tRNA(Ile)-lysidine synthase TilS/MesJ